MAHLFAGCTEQDGRFRLVKTQQVDHRVLDLGRGDGHGLVGDVAVAAAFADRRDAQRLVLVAAGERLDRARHGGREQQRAAGVGGGIEDRLELLAEAHVEHLVGFIQHRDSEGGKVQRAALEMVAQPAGGADDDRRTRLQDLALGRGVHAAHAGGDPCAGVPVKPLELAADLQGKLAGGGDDEREGRLGEAEFSMIVKQLACHGEAKGNRLARTGLGRDDEIAACRLGAQDFGLDRGRLGIAAGGEGCFNGGGQGGEGDRGHGGGGLVRYGSTGGAGALEDRRGAREDKGRCRCQPAGSRGAHSRKCSKARPQSDARPKSPVFHVKHSSRAALDGVWRGAERGWRGSGGGLEAR